MKKKKVESYEEIKKIDEELAQAGDKDPGHAPLLTSNAWKFWLIGVVVVLLGYFIFQSLSVIYLVVAGFVISMALENAITRLQRWMRRGMAIFVAYILLIIFLLSGVVIVVPFVIQQIADIVNLLMDKVIHIQTLLQEQGLIQVISDTSLPLQIKANIISSIEQGNWLGGLQTALVDNMSQIASLGSGYIKNAGTVAVSLVGGVFSAFIQISIVLILAIFFSIEKEKVITFLARLTKNAEYTELKILKLYRKLGFWLKGQLLLCIIIGVAVGFGLTVLGRIGVDIPNKFTLALMAGLVEFIPYVGPFLGMLPAILLGALAHGWTGVLAVIILYWIIQQSENNILVPMVMHHALGISPLLIFLSMILGGSLFGFLGVILAVPFAVIVNILFEDYKNSGKTSS